MKLPLLTAITAIALAGCAQFNDGLLQVNDALGQANASLSGSAAPAGQAITIADKVTGQYEIRNLKLMVEHISDVTNVRFTGQAYNKTAKLIQIAITVPIYDQKGFYVRRVHTDVSLPPKEKKQIDALEPFAFKEGQHLEPRKTQFDVTVY